MLPSISKLGTMLNKHLVSDQFQSVKDALLSVSVPGVSTFAADKSVSNEEK